MLYIFYHNLKKDQFVVTTFISHLWSSLYIYFLLPFCFSIHILKTVATNSAWPKTALLFSRNQNRLSVDSHSSLLQILLKFPNFPGSVVQCSHWPFAPVSSVIDLFSEPSVCGFNDGMEGEDAVLTKQKNLII